MFKQRIDSKTSRRLRRYSPTYLWLLFAIAATSLAKCSSFERTAREQAVGSAPTPPIIARVVSPRTESMVCDESPVATTAACTIASGTMQNNFDLILGGEFGIIVEVPPAIPYEAKSISIRIIITPITVQGERKALAEPIGIYMLYYGTKLRLSDIARRGGTLHETYSQLWVKADEAGFQPILRWAIPWKALLEYSLPSFPYRVVGENTISVGFRYKTTAENEYETVSKEYIIQEPLSFTQAVTERMQDSGSDGENVSKTLRLLMFCASSQQKEALKTLAAYCSDTRITDQSRPDVVADVAANYLAHKVRFIEIDRRELPKQAEDRIVLYQAFAKRVLDNYDHLVFSDGQWQRTQPIGEEQRHPLDRNDPSNH